LKLESLHPIVEVGKVIEGGLGANEIHIDTIIPISNPTREPYTK